MNNEITKIAAYCLSTALSNEPWQDINYGKRPKYGSIIRRFRNQWKVDLEKIILREFVIIFSAAHVVAGAVDDSAIEELSGLYAGFNNHENMYIYFGYTTRGEAIDHFHGSITEYVNRATEEWPSLLLDHLAIDKIPDEKIKAKLFVGCAQFGQTMRLMIAAIKNNRTQQKNQGDGD